MKKILNKSKNTFLLLLLLCCIFNLSSAFLPYDSITPISEADCERVETEMGLSMIDCPADTILSVDSIACTASGELHLPTNIVGLCGGNEFNAETFGGGNLTVMGSLENNDLSIFASDFAPGTHLIQYMVNDSCGNVFNCDYEVVVPPLSATVVLKQNIVVALSPSSVGGVATTTIYADSIDNGSSNPCSPIKLEIRREVDLCGIPGNATYNADGHPNDGDPDPSSADYDSDDGQFVKFCCEDLTSTLYDIDNDGINDIGYVKVWMRVWDDTNLDSIPGNEGDSYTEGWTYVKVIDQLAPVITCPPDVTITCDINYTDLNMTGSAIGYGSCGEVDVEFTDIIINLNTCNEGFVRRRFNIVGRSDIFCDQTITMIGIDAPVTVSFSQVEDFTTSNCPDMIEIGEPTWTAGPCDVLGYTIDTDTFYFEDSACLKLVNQITVINWCDYMPNDPTWNGEGLWEHTQVVKVVDVTIPVLQNCEDHEVCDSMVTLTNVANDSGSENCPSGWLRWQVFVDLSGDGTNDFEFSSFLPPFDNSYNDTNGNGIPDIYLNPTNTGEEVNIQLPGIVEGSEIHKVTWKVTDGCNNVTICDSEFIVADQTPPTAVCQDSITVDLVPKEPSILWAIDYVPDVMDNCTSTDDIRYTFSATPPEDDPSYDPDLLSSNYEVTPNDEDIGSVVLSIYIWDETGNYSICETVFIIDPTIVLNTEETTDITANALHQNYPNPFRLNTSISFNLDRSTPVKLTIMNAVSSKTVEVEIEGKKGLNTYGLDHELLSGQGLYYYTIATKYYKETKKMILIN
jgi:hypothetical protein